VKRIVIAVIAVVFIAVIAFELGERSATPHTPVLPTGKITQHCVTRTTVRVGPCKHGRHRELHPLPGHVL
jgi:hypothetical protein